MSMFIGKNYQGNSVLHISKNDAPLEYLKNNPGLVNTAFHSDLNYLTMKMWVGHTYVRGYSETSGGWTETFDCIILTQAFLNYAISNGNYGFIVVIDGRLITDFGMMGYVTAQFPAFTYGNYFGTVRGYPTYACTAIRLPMLLGHTPTVEIYTMNVTYNGYAPLYKVGNEIRINNSSITVRGITLNSFDYITTQQLNPGDPALYSYYRVATSQLGLLYGYNEYASTALFLVRPSRYSGNMQIDKNSIKIGGYTIFSAQASAGKLQYRDMSTKYHSILNSGTNMLLSDFFFAEGELFILVNLFGDNAPYFVPYTFRNGAIAHVGSWINWNQMRDTSAQLTGIGNYLYLTFTDNIGTANISVNCRLLRFNG